MHVVFTIGYEGTDIATFIETLKAVGVERVADVRALALSRKKGFSKKSLAENLEQADIEYVHLQKLGDPKPGRDAARAGEYEKFEKIYWDHLLSQPAQESLNVLRKLVSEKPTCLLCFERDHETCHRSIVASELFAEDIEIFNLVGDDPKRYVRNADKLPRFNSCESFAAA